MSSNSIRLRALLLVGSVVAIGVSTVSGCPGTIDDIDRFKTSAGSACDVEGNLFPTKCADALCHNPTDHVAGLDLVSPGVPSRVVGQTASPMDECVGELIVDPADPENSLIYSKLLEPPPCGTRMPFTKPELSEEEKQCVLDWIGTLGAGGGMGGMGMGGMATGGAMGGMGGMGMGGAGGAGGN